MKDKIVSLDKLKDIAVDLKKNGKKVISTSGCFDILHAGHVTYLEEARAKGDALIVLLNSDASVRSLKGENRPIVPEMERATVIAGLSSVDYVCVFDDKTPCAIIEEIQPDIVIKGGDYEGKHIPEMDSVRLYGGSVAYVSAVDGLSTTNIVEKIKELGKNE